MEFQITFWVAAFFFIASLLKGHRAFLFFAVFFVPFSAVSVVDFPSLRTSLNFSTFFAVLYVFYFYMVKLRVFYVIQIRLFYPFLILVLLLIMNYFILEPKIDLSSPFAQNPGVSQLLYLLLGILVAFAIAVDVARNQHYEIIVRATLYSMIVVSCIGLYQFFSYYLELIYPSKIFNNSISSNALGYKAVTDLGVKRISSVSTEPSIYVQFVLPSLVLALFWYLKTTKKRFSRFFIFIFLPLTSLILSTSFSAYVGLFFLISFFVLFASYGVVYKALFITFSFLVFSVLATVFYELIDLKFHSYSFGERLESVIYGLEIFSVNPVLGLGWGSVTSHNMIVGVLANSGMIGLLLLFSPLLLILRKSFRLKTLKEQCFLGQGVTLAFLIVLVLQILTGFAYVYMIFWVFFGVLLGENVYCKKVINDLITRVSK